MLQAQRTVLQTLKLSYSTTNFTEYIESLSQSYSTTTSDLISATTNLSESWQKCLEGLNDQQLPAACEALEEAEIILLKQLNVNARSYMARDIASNHYENTSEVEAEIDASIVTIDKDIDSLVAQQQSAVPTLPSGAEEISGNWGLSEAEHDDGWFEFQFDTTASGHVVLDTTETYSAAFSYGARAGLWSVSGDIQSSFKDASLARYNSEVKITAKLLPLQIHRKWFMPSFFKTPQLMMVRMS